MRNESSLPTPSATALNWPPSTHIRAFAEILQTHSGQHGKDWITATRTADLPRQHTFATALEK
ncbi:hypothetical protein [Streptomyces sp. TLI_105]|uniref:hypothetical protein n=1 Tax=Streptomyces sp. TLI_105 TaxID=1881019 RepID=UPI00089576FC|nr:hypothetical protein [Streptomyces sp. TLI_105]SEB63468.1 hypothetical protein SAMN05428939_0270 [Streptomyces sp. TLI_105]